MTASIFALILKASLSDVEDIGQIKHTNRSSRMRAEEKRDGRMLTRREWIRQGAMVGGGLALSTAGLAGAESALFDENFLPTPAFFAIRDSFDKASKR